MKQDSFRHIIRGILILIVQVLILKRISGGSSWLWLHGDIADEPLRAVVRGTGIALKNTDRFSFLIDRKRV